MKVNLMNFEDILQHEIQHLLNIFLFALGFQSSRRAFPDASAAACTGCVIDADLCFLPCNGAGGTDCRTVSAAEALLRIPENLHLRKLAFGVGTPKTVHRASFQKYDSTNPRAVVQTEFLNVEYGTAHRTICRHLDTPPDAVIGF